MPETGGASASGGWGGGWGRNLAAGLIGALAGAALVILFLATAGRGWMEGVVRDYILANPEIIPEAIDRLQQRESAAVVDQHRAALETPFHSAWAGAEDGDVVLVEFFDYACGFCRASNPVVDRLIEEDKRLKVVWRELPVLGPDSEQAAFASLAAARQGEFRKFHATLFGLGRPTPAAIERARGATNVQAPERTDEFVRELEQNFELARAVRATGTPTFVVGDRVLQGAVGYDALKEAIEEARARS